MWNLSKTIRAGGAYCRIRVLYALRSVYADGFDFADLLGGKTFGRTIREAPFFLSAKWRTLPVSPLMTTVSFCSRQLSLCSEENKKTRRD